LREKSAVIATHTGNTQSLEYIAEVQKKYSDFSGEKLDATSEADVAAFYKRLQSGVDRVDILCNLVGGVSAKKFIEEIELDEWNKMIALNLTSCFLMMRGAVSFMKRHKWGRIVNIAAMPAVIPEAKRGGYGVSKSGVITLTKTVSEEVKEYNTITVNAIAPSIILTQENKSWGSEEDFKKWVTPEQITDMIVHLCSENGAAFNGQIIQMYGKV
ncbi:MAG: SDR family oxidoreductase, partial [Bacteroidota bacterium]